MNTQEGRDQFNDKIREAERQSDKYENTMYCYLALGSVGAGLVITGLVRMDSSHGFFLFDFHQYYRGRSALLFGLLLILIGFGPAFFFWQQLEKEKAMVKELKNERAKLQ